MNIMFKPLPVPSQVAPGVPAGFDRFWERATKRDPSERFQTASELVIALAAALGVRLADEALDTSEAEPPQSSVLGPDSAQAGIATMRTVMAAEPREHGTLAGHAQTSPGAQGAPRRIRPVALGLALAAAVAVALGFAVVRSSGPAPPAVNAAPLPPAPHESPVNVTVEPTSTAQPPATADAASPPSAAVATVPPASSALGGRLPGPRASAAPDPSSVPPAAASGNPGRDFGF